MIPDTPKELASKAVSVEPIEAPLSSEYAEDHPPSPRRPQQGGGGLPLTRHFRKEHIMIPTQAQIDAGDFDVSYQFSGRMTADSEKAAEAVANLVGARTWCTVATTSSGTCVSLSHSAGWPRSTWAMGGMRDPSSAFWTTARLL